MSASGADCAIMRRATRAEMRRLVAWAVLAALSGCADDADTRRTHGQKLLVCGCNCNVYD